MLFQVSLLSDYPLKKVDVGMVLLVPLQGPVVGRVPVTP